MKDVYFPLKNNWSVNEDAGFVPDQIQNRVDTEDLYTWCKRYPLIKKVEGRAGEPKNDFTFINEA